jgi:hypothetical protein
VFGFEFGLTARFVNTFGPAAGDDPRLAALAREEGAAGHAERL